MFLSFSLLYCFFLTSKTWKIFTLFRRQDSSIGFGAPVRANMRSGGVTDAAVTSSLLETVSIYAIVDKTNGSL